MLEYFNLDHKNLTIDAWDDNFDIYELALKIAEILIKVNVSDEYFSSEEVDKYISTDNKFKEIYNFIFLKEFENNKRKENILLFFSLKFFTRINIKAFLKFFPAFFHFSHKEESMLSTIIGSFFISFEINSPSTSSLHDS